MHMHDEAKEYDLERLIRAIDNATATPPARLLERIAAGEPLDNYEVEWWLTECRAVQLMMVGVKAMWRLLDWPVTEVCHKPVRQVTASSWGVRADEFVAGLLRLYRFGVDLGAHQAAAAYRPRLERRKRFTLRELDIWWYRSPSKDDATIKARRSAAGMNPVRLAPPRWIATNTGYELYLSETKDGQHLLLTSARCRRKRAAA